MDLVFTTNLADAALVSSLEFVSESIDLNDCFELVVRIGDILSVTLICVVF